MADGRGCQKAANLSNICLVLLSLGERWGTHEGWDLLQARYQGCDGDVGGTSSQDLWVPLAPQAPCVTVATPAPHGSGAHGCANTGAG